MTPVSEAAASPRARAFPWLAYSLVALVGVAALLGGLALRYDMIGGPEAVVSQVRITARPGIDLGKIEDVLDTPDYYVEVETAHGTHATQVFKDTRVGSGLTFPLPAIMRLADLREVRLFDKDVMKDNLVDRVDRPAERAVGERFEFELSGPDRPQPGRKVGLGLAICGGAVLLIAAIRFIWYQVI